jgi:hypothetical protein
LCMALALVLSTPVMAQSASASASPGREGDPCGSFVIGTPEADECYRSFGLEPLEPETASPSADPCPDPNFPRETPDGCQASDLPDVSFGADASPTASSTASPTASSTASASAAASSLPETGGPVSVMALVPLALLLGTGLLALRLVRRS